MVAVNGTNPGIVDQELLLDANPWAVLFGIPFFLFFKWDSPGKFCFRPQKLACTIWYFSQVFLGVL